MNLILANLMIAFLMQNNDISAQNFEKFFSLTEKYVYEKDHEENDFCDWINAIEKLKTKKNN